MQVGTLRHRGPTPSLARTPGNHDFEISSWSRSRSSGEMLAPTGLTWGTGHELYTNGIMGQAPSAVEDDYSSTILREDCIRIEESELSPRTPDSGSLLYESRNRAPFSRKSTDKMITQNSILQLPRNNASHDLAFFLRTTGPSVPQRRPSNVDSQRRRGPKDALRFFKVGQRRSSISAEEALSAHQKCELCKSDAADTKRLKVDDVLFSDEGGLLEGYESPVLPQGVKQKFSSAGQKYPAVQGPDQPVESKDYKKPIPRRSLGIVSSGVSITFPDETSTSEHLEDWLYTLTKERSSFGYGDVDSQRASTVAPLISVTHPEESTVRMVQGSSPIRPAASSPPTPQPLSAVTGSSTWFEDAINDSRHSYEAAKALSSHPLNQAELDRFCTPRASIALPNDEFSTRRSTREKSFEIFHPFPQRMGSHPVLLNRTSSIASAANRRSRSDSPGPPPRSPLRPVLTQRNLDGVANPATSFHKPIPKLAPSIRSISEYSERDPFAATVITECTGPIKRPKSRGKGTRLGAQATRKAREDRIKARKLRDRPMMAANIDAVVQASSSQEDAPRRLRKRPQIQIPEMKPAPLAPRCTSAASTRSNGSWRKITETTLTPVSGSPAQGSPVSPIDKTGYTPISATASHESKTSEMTLSPVMMIAEEVPLPKVQTSPRLAKVVVKDGKTYSPRPRSASMSRAASKRRSARGLQTPPRSVSPGNQRPKRGNTPPPLPSPAPNRALPPTPPMLGSERSATAGANRLPLPQSGHEAKELPTSPVYEITPATRDMTPRASELVPHIVTQVRDRPPSVKSTRTARFNARLEALEKQNALLQAALVAVLSTSGSLNGPLSNLVAPTSPTDSSTWEPPRDTRRSQSSHAPSSSNGSALEMYMNTRRGEKHHQI